MSKKVLVITSSLRANSNSDALADSFADGAKSSGNTVEVISLKDKSISFCRGCMSFGMTRLRLRRRSKTLMWRSLLRRFIIMSWPAS